MPSTALIPLIVAAAGLLVPAAAAPAVQALRSYADRHAGPPTLQVLHAFSGGTDGALPAGGLLVDKSFVLYGTTEAGGAKNMGTAFQLTPSESGYVESVIHSFVAGSKDGAFPVASLTAGKDGILYGTTVGGGRESANRSCTSSDQYAGCGTVFALTPSSGGYVEQLEYRFKGGTKDGRQPYGSVFSGADGTLYGTTLWGKGPNLGTVFALTSSGEERAEYSFRGASRNGRRPVPDGALPSGALAIDAGGTMYGTAAFGGDGTCRTNRRVRCGVVYALAPTGSGYAYSRLYSFRGGDDGQYPQAGVIVDAAGALYGTTEIGGAANLGIVFKLTPTASGYTETILHAFRGGDDGALPVSGLVLDSQGALYGTTSSGGNANLGTVFKLTLKGSGYAERVLYAFTGGNDGAQPVAPLTLGKSGVLYGTAHGGAYGMGTVFAIGK
jgi:uncharacterized repeat protein (TIGR03803 family)